MPRLKTRSISSSSTAPSDWISPKIAGSLPGGALEHGPEPGGQHPGQVADDPASGDVGAGVQRLAQRGAHGQHGRGVDDRGAQQLVGQRVRRPGPGRVAELRARPARAGRGGPACSRSSAARARKADDDVAGAHPLGAQLGALLDHADGEAGQVEVVGRHEAGVLRRLPADEGAAGLAAALVDAGHHGGHLIGVDLAGGQVVEHEERLGAEADQVVDAHGDQVDAHGVVAAGGLGHHQLGPHAVGGGHQHRPGVAGQVEGELAAEAADAGHQARQARSTAASPAPMSTPAPA